MPGWSVLIIDDDLDTRANLRDVLELDSYRVVEAESVTDALEESNWSECLAILLNRRLRNESMALLLPRLRQVAPNSAVIVVTAHDDVAGAIEALRQGAIDYLLKPINPDELRARLGRVAEHRRLEEQQRESDRFARSVLDSLSANVAVLDDSGGIVAVNRAWRNFAVANGTGDMSVAEGANYFDVCARVTGIDAETARLFATGIHEVLAGRRETFALEYPCHAPHQQRWFVGQITPFHADGPRKVVVAHVDITDRKHAEAAVNESAARLQAVSRRVVEIQEQDRRHIARELHDEIGQVLSVIGVNLHALKGVCDESAGPRIEESLSIVDQAIQQVRNLSLDLRPSMLDDLGLVATLRWYADRQAQRAGFAASLNVESSTHRPPAEQATACFRVVQEALTNVVRHARARNVWIELRQGDETLNLAVRDDGDGFDAEAARQSAARGESFGLPAIQERVELLGGRFEIESQRKKGTSIRASFPIAPASMTTRSPNEGGIS